MKRHSLLVLFALSNLLLQSQQVAVQGKVTDAITAEPLPYASISLYKTGHISGVVSNKEGQFAIAGIAGYDSLKISMVGYHSTILSDQELAKACYFDIKLTPAPASLQEVVVKAAAAIEIIKHAIEKISGYLPNHNFESKGFYREIIKDRDNYFSVAEAIFRAQYFTQKQMYKLQLLQGRSKEDVTYTRLFEDFHPGGGPQLAAGNSFITNRPDFLNLKKINDFTYKIDSLVQFDGQWLYSISFDQKPNIKEALEKGRLLINRDDYSIIRYEAANSPYGTPYIKSLSGTDKIFARLLNIEFQKKGWKKRVDFSKVDDKWLMSYAEAALTIAYRQPRKNIDLDLNINIEWLVTDLELPVQKEISKEEEWKNKNIIAGLPGIFDSAYWGTSNVISPTETVNHIVAGISKTNNDTAAINYLPGWSFINRNFFVASRYTDTINVVPIMKCVWEDDETGGMLYKELQGDFTIESKINIAKKTNPEEMPDRGFQQAGIMIRSPDTASENYLLLTAGTGGNPNAKLFFKKTTGNKSKTVINKIDNMNGWLRMERKGNVISAFFKKQQPDHWKKIGEYEVGWLSNTVQTGLAVYARFAGDGPKMQPDMRAEFSHLQIDQK